MVGRLEWVLEGQSSTNRTGTEWPAVPGIPVPKAVAAQQLGECPLEPDGLGSSPSPGTYHLCGHGQNI